MNLDEYFDLPDSPAAKSPAAALMRRILEEKPSMSIDEARQVAHNQLLKAAGRKNYRVSTPSQDEKRFARFDATLKSGKTAYPREAQ